MKFCSISKSKLLFLAGLFMFSTVGVVQAKECDMSDSIAAGDSAAVRAECPDEDKAKNKPKKQKANPNNSRSTDGTERPDDRGTKGQGYSDTGPKR